MPTPRYSAPPGLKPCSSCGETKPLDDFYVARRRWDGRHAFCKPCQNKATRSSRAKNPDKARRSTAAWREQNAEHYRLGARARSLRWARRQGRVYWRLLQRSRVLRREPGAVEYGEVLIDDPCSYCGGRGGEIDHVVPLKSGGTHAIDNLTAACPRCNRSKGARGLLPCLLLRATAAGKEV